jgi:hypothetical protein
MHGHLHFDAKQNDLRDPIYYAQKVKCLEQAKLAIAGG